MDDETQPSAAGTLAPDAPPEGVQPATPVPDAPPEAPPEGTGPAAPPPEGEPPEQPPEAPPWTGRDTPEAVLEHEAFTPLVDEIKAQARRDGASDAQARIQPWNERAATSLASADEGIQAMRQQLEQITEDGTLDQAAVRKVISQNPQALAAFNQAKYTDGTWDGFTSAISALAQTMGEPSVATDFQPRIQTYKEDVQAQVLAQQQGRQPLPFRDPNIFSDLISRIGKARYEEGDKKGYARGAKEGKAAGTAQTAIKANKGEGANLAPGTPSGGRSDRERKLDPATSVPELIEIRTREKAAGE